MIPTRLFRPTSLFAFLLLAPLAFFSSFAAPVSGQTTPAPTFVWFSGTLVAPSCQVEGLQPKGSPQIGGTVTLNDLTTGKSLGTESLGTTSVILFQAPFTIDQGPVKAFTLGDFNGDGHLDVAFAGGVYLGNGDGTFHNTALPFTVNYAPIAFAAADMNGDGKMDLLTVNTGGPVGGNDSVSVLLGNGDGTFGAPVSFEVGVGAHALVLGDFNGDNKLDIAVTNLFDSSISILLGNGDGTFAPQTTIPVTEPPRDLPESISSADFNGDGKLDLALITIDGVDVLLGNGHGGFNDTGIIASGVTYPTGIATGDFNHDGKVDIATNGQNGSAGPALSILLGNGNGTFQAPQIIVDHTGSSDGNLVVADINQDGNLDLATGGGVWFGDGNGGFSDSRFYSSTMGRQLTMAGDLNGDGRIDVVTISTGNSLQASLNGYASAIAKFDPMADYGTTPAHTVECSYSGDPNYAAGTGSAAVDFFVEQSPTFTSSGLVQVPWSVFFYYPSYLNLYYTTDGSTPAPNSNLYTGKGIPVNGAMTIKAMLWGGPGTFPGYAEASYLPQVWTPSTIPGGGTYPPGLRVQVYDWTPGATVYYTIDGSTPTPATKQYTSLIPINSTTTLKLFGTYPGFADSAVATAVYTIQPFVTAPVLSLPSGSYSAPQTVSITESQTGATVHYTTDGTPPFPWSPVYTSPVTINSNTTLRAIATEAGYYDSPMAQAVYTTNVSSSVLQITSRDPLSMSCTVSGSPFFSGEGPTGQVTFSDATTGSTLATAALGTASRVPDFRRVSQDIHSGLTVLGDFNGDGKVDLVAGLYLNGIASGSASVRFGNGDGTFQSGAKMIQGLNPYSPMFISGDFNGDGKMDLVTFEGPLAVALGNGDGTFQDAMVQTFSVQGVAPNTDAPAGQLLASDVNGDGKLDLIGSTITPGHGTVAVFLGNGDGTFKAPTTLSLGSIPKFASGDFNGDGKADIASIDSATGNVTVFLSNGDGTFQAGIVTPALPITRAPGSIVAADFNGDGHLDLAVGSDAEQGVLILLANGDGTFQNQPNLTVSAPGFSSLATADFNGDGFLDLVIPTTSGNSPVIAFGHGTERFPLPSAISRAIPLFPEG